MGYLTTHILGIFISFRQAFQKAEISSMIHSKSLYVPKVDSNSRSFNLHLWIQRSWHFNKWKKMLSARGVNRHIFCAKPNIFIFVRVWLLGCLKLLSKIFCVKWSITAPWTGCQRKRNPTRVLFPRGNRWLVKKMWQQFILHLPIGSCLQEPCVNARSNPLQQSQHTKDL